MLTRVSIAAAAALLATLATSKAATTTVDGSYTAYSTETSGPGNSNQGAQGSQTYAPTINNDGGAFQSSPFVETNMTVGSTVGPTTFLQVAPINGGSGVNTVKGTVAVNFTFTVPADNATVTGVTYTTGANAATVSAGVVSVTANYELYYASTPYQSDCITWSAATCTADSNNPNDVTNNVVGDTLVLSFSDGAVLDVALYNWSDWNMAPQISYTLASGPTTGGGHTNVPEPASLTIFASGIAGLGAMRRRRIKQRQVIDPAA